MPPAPLTPIAADGGAADGGASRKSAGDNARKAPNFVGGAAVNPGVLFYRRQILQ